MSEHMIVQAPDGSVVICCIRLLFLINSAGADVAGEGFDFPSLSIMNDTANLCPFCGAGRGDNKKTS